MDIAIPEEIVNEAVRRFGRKFLFVSPEKYFTNDDILAGSKKPTGKRHYGICTACGKRSEDVDPPPNENEKRHKPFDHYGAPRSCIGQVRCPKCGELVEARKGQLDKFKLHDEFYLKAWDCESREKVILYEACFYLKEWTDVGPNSIRVYYQRKTILTPKGAETYEWQWESWVSDKQLWAKLNIPKTMTGTLPRFCEMGREQLAYTFLHNIDEYIREHKLTDNYLIRFVEEPLTELFYKMGFTGLASDRVYKDKPTKGTRHIDFTQRSPKKMFRGIDRKTEQKTKQLLKLISGQRKYCFDCADLEAAIAAFKKCKSATPEAVADLLDERGQRCAKGFTSILKLSTKITAFPFDRVVDYIKSHDLNIYRDYLETAIANGAPLNEARTAFPDDLNAAHDEQTEKREYALKKESFDKCAKRVEKLRKLGYEFEWNGICTVIPEKPTDIQREGKVLGHCVGSLYTDKHVEGKSNIIFIRRAADRENPWFTLEVDPKTKQFRQCYGFKNQVRGADDPKVGSFLKKYAAHLERAAKNKGKKIQEDNKCRKTA